MFNGWIELGLVSQAYGLDAEECIELAQHISRKYGRFSNNQPYDIKYIDELAKSYARNLLKKSNKQSYFIVYYTAMKGWRNITLEQAKIDFEPLNTILSNNTNDFAFDALWPIARLLFITDISVNKREMIEFLYQNGYSLQQEVKGITRALVEDIISNILSSDVALQPSAGDDMTHCRLNSPSSKGSNKDIERIKATRTACESVREEIERGEHGFLVKGEYKTNRVHFQKAVQALLGSEKVHRDTLRDEWTKVPENIKHSGRMPDQ